MVRDEEIARTVEGDPEGSTELGGGSGAVDTAKGTSHPGYGRDHPGCGDLPDSAIARVRHIHAAGIVNYHADGRVELRGGAAPVRTAIAARQTSQRGDHSAGTAFANGAVVVIRDVDVAGVVDGEAGGLIEFDRGACAVGAAWFIRRARQGGNRTVWSDFPDIVAVRIRNIDVACTVNGHAGGIKEPRGGANTVLCSLGSRSAGKGGDGTIWCDFPDATIEGVRHVEIVVGVHCHTGWRVKKRRGAAAIRAAWNARAAGHGRGYSGGANLPDGMVAHVRHVDIPAAVDRYAHGSIELGAEAGAISAALRAG